MSAPGESSDGSTLLLTRCLGVGGFGEVYEGTLRTRGGLTRQVAVKVLRADLDPAGDAAPRLRDEARVLAALDAPSVMRVHDLVELDGRIGLIADYVRGADLAACLADGLPRRPLVEAVATVAWALDAVSSAADPSGRPLELVHRDVKPSNIQIAASGVAVLLDFGIAHSTAAEREVTTESGMLVGSAPYMAPERFTAEGDGPPGDVYALGCVLFEGLASCTQVPLERT